MTRISRRFLSIGLLVCALALAISASAYAAGSSYDPNPLAGSSFQGADGNQDAAPDAGGSGTTDWQSYAANPDVLHERIDQPVDGTGTLDYFYKGHESTPTDWIKDSVSGGITPDKSNALAQWSITDPLTSDVFFYFSFLRASTSNADAFYGIELFHDGHLWRNGNTNTDGSPTEIPCRSNGDLMISYEIDPSNKNVAIKFYEWANGAGPSSSDPLQNCPEGATGDFVPANPAPSAAQAYMNFDGDIKNYLNTVLFGDTISTGRFAEGAVNLDEALNTDLSGKPCFSFGYAQLHSRSSSSLDSAMQDTIDPAPVKVANCTLNIDKTVRVRTGDTESNPAPGGDTYADSANATVGQTLDYKFVVSVPNGSKSMQIDDPTDVLGTDPSDPAYCAPTSVDDQDGFNIGDANQNDLVDAGEQWIYKCSYTTTSGDVQRSPLHNTAFVTGRVPDCVGELQFCGSSDSDDATANVAKAQPTLATTASNGSEGSEQTVGGTITDTATVSGGYAPLTGSVTFSVYAPGDTSCDTALDWGDGKTSKTVTLDNGQATSPAFTTSAVGTYRWVASYSGDANNNGADGACNDPGEASLTKKAQPQLSTTASPTTELGHKISDVAHVSGGYNPTGTVTFSVYGPGDTTCQTPLDWGEDQTSVTVDLVDGEATSPDFTPAAVGTYRFVASYSGDANNLPANGACNDEGESVDVLQPSLAIDKTGPDHAYDGDVITFTITVTNPGSSPVHDVTLTDQIKGSTSTCDSISGPTGDANSDGLLQPSETWVYSCTYTVKHADEDSTHHVTNVATVSGKNSFGDGVGPVSDDHPVLVVHPAIAIDKSGPANATQGEKVSYTLTVTNPGDEGFAESTVKVADEQCNGDPVTLIGKGGDATPGSLDPGDTWTYSCSVQTAVGQTSIHNVATVTGCDQFGKCVNANDAADTILDAQVVAGERIPAASARLLGPTGCVAKAFNARIRGVNVATVTFVLDGKVIKKVNNTKRASVILARINPAKLKLGVHRLVANVTFRAETKKKPTSLRLSFQRCGKKLVAPRFTG